LHNNRKLFIVISKRPNKDDKQKNMAARGVEINLPEGAAEVSFVCLPQENIQEPDERALFLARAVGLTGVRNSRKELAPTDELTGMPLPILPPDERLDIKDKITNNWHHHYHPSDSMLLGSTDGLAVRHVRLQNLPKISHHNLYHSIFEGPTLPRTSEERFGHIILACAGYVPTSAIDVRKGDPTKPVDLSNKMRRRLQTSGELDVRGQTNISTFIRKHLIYQDFSHVKESLIDEFVNTRDIDRRLYLGHLLLAIASEIAVEPIKPVYSQALQEGLIAKPISPKKLPGVVKAHVNGEKTANKAIRSLRTRLQKVRS
jgi:hypothetical protein